VHCRSRSVFKKREKREERGGANDLFCLGNAKKQKGMPPCLSRPQEKGGKVVMTNTEELFVAWKERKSLMTFPMKKKEGSWSANLAQCFAN